MKRSLRLLDLLPLGLGCALLISASSVSADSTSLESLLGASDAEVVLASASPVTQDGVPFLAVGAFEKRFSGDGGRRIRTRIADNICHYLKYEGAQSHTVELVPFTPTSLDIWVIDDDLIPLRSSAVAYDVSTFEDRLGAFRDPSAEPAPIRRTEIFSSITCYKHVPHAKPKPEPVKPKIEAEQSSPKNAPATPAPAQATLKAGKVTVSVTVAK